MKSKDTTTWEQRFEKQFGDMITSGLWFTLVREFIRQELASQLQEVAEGVEKMKRDPHGIYGESLATQWTMGFDSALDEVLSLIEEERKE